MICPHCNSEEDRVVDSRNTKDGHVIRRRRECLSCGERFTTYERIDELPYMVIKKDGRREKFNREKLLNGLITACEKRPVSTKELENIVDKVEDMFAEASTKEISSQKIGSLVMEHLEELDKVAYVRFASVYREFKDVDEFMNELRDIIT